MRERIEIEHSGNTPNFIIHRISEVAWWLSTNMFMTLLRSQRRKKNTQTVHFLNTHLKLNSILILKYPLNSQIND